MNKLLFIGKIVSLPHAKEETILVKPNQVPAAAQMSEKPATTREEKPATPGKKAGKKGKTGAKSNVAAGGTIKKVLLAQLLHICICAFSLVRQ